MSKIQSVVLSGVILISLQGCVAATIGATLGGMTVSNPHFFESEEECKTKSYPQYVKDMKTVNAEQVKQHLTPSATDTVEQYCHLEKKETSTNKTASNQK